MNVLIKGAGDLATGIGFRLFRAGYTVWMTDLKKPTAVRRRVSFSAAIYQGECCVEGVKAAFAANFKAALCIQERNHIPVLADPHAGIRNEYQPDVIVDAIMAKRNTGTEIMQAGLVIGIGPGFFAGSDCHYVIETKRGHDLGKVIAEGAAIPNTGIPGDIGGFTVERLIKANEAGEFHPLAEIGDYVELDQTVAMVSNKPIKARMSGIIRGMLQKGAIVYQGMKVGDIDARCKVEHCYTISDKARAIGGGVLEVICAFEHSKN